MHWIRKVVTVGFFAAAMLPQPAFSVSVREYDQARHDQQKQSDTLKAAYETAIAQAVAGLRDRHFSDGREKSPERVKRDRERADRIDYLVRHVTKERSRALIQAIDQAVLDEPNRELVDVIITFLMNQSDPPSDGRTLKEK
jgi:hypothetical protein